MQDPLDSTTIGVVEVPEGAAAIANALLATALAGVAAATAIARTVAEVVRVTGPVYSFEPVVGVDPSVV